MILLRIPLFKSLNFSFYCYFTISGTGKEDEKYDIIYVLDGSQGVSAKAFNDVKQFITQQLKLYKISSSETRVGFVVIGDNKQYTAPTGDLGTIKRAMEELRRTDSVRRVDETLYFLQQKMGDFRRINNKIVVLFVHGSTSREGKLNLASNAKVLYGEHVLF